MATGIVFREGNGLDSFLIPYELFVEETPMSRLGLTDIWGACGQNAQITRKPLIFARKYFLNSSCADSLDKKL